MKNIVVLDTNIFVSSVFWEGSSYRLVKKTINQEIVVFVSDFIINEIRKVLVRDFSLGKQEIDDIVNSIAYFTHLIGQKKKLKQSKKILMMAESWNVLWPVEPNLS